MQLTKNYRLEIAPSNPFNFDKTFFKPDHFTSGDNFWQPGIRWQTFKWFGKDLGIKFENKSSFKNPKVKVSVYTSESLYKKFLESLKEEMIYRYNLGLNLRDFYSQFKNDRVLSPVIQKLKGMRPGHPSSLYEYLIIGVVLQNASVRRSIQMFRALLENYANKVEYDGKTLWCFWEPGRLRNVKEEELRLLKVGYRAKFIKKIDEYFSEGKIDEFNLRDKSAEYQKTELLKLYGVGPATVWYLLFDVFHHWDVFDHVSPWEQKIYTKLLFDKSPDKPAGEREILKKISGFGKYRHLAVHYLWENLWWDYREGESLWLGEFIRT